ncbi:hypothetical protein SAMN04487969_13652 [Paenibacillus algorifonticola]|uniref:Helix-turn-helix conjugative transposon-like domain-containing protein n=1 Tax=Paenibacillus algorifonticola TaxID=684063 RepID=A0A1I2ILI0_9BACL|nr:hypothetical protein [Paenibacillus algorifonticola]SFF41897.1 hypothetical protein SAMN04487969_13652 [Paenibacillus algorifonticola]
MEAKNVEAAMSDDEFLRLLDLVQQNDEQATLALIRFFEPEMKRISRFIRMPQEDAVQSMTAELLAFFKEGQATP